MTRHGTIRATIDIPDQHERDSRQTPRYSVTEYWDGRVAVTFVSSKPGMRRTMDEVYRRLEAQGLAIEDTADTAQP